MSITPPTLPEPAHADLDSMLSRKFGKEVANYLSGSPLNRVSFLRTDHAFLTQALNHPSTLFVIFNNLNPLIKSAAELAYATLEDVRPLIGEKPYEKPEEQLIGDYNSTIFIPQLVFLGLDERSNNGITYKNIYKGAPVFALDVTPKGSVSDAAEELISKLQERNFRFAQGRHQLSLNASEAAVYAEARSVIDWNLRNPFCAQCGQPTLSVNAGFKRTCPPRDLALLSGALTTTGDKPSAFADRPPCATRSGISNLSFPRTDPTVIMAVVSADGQRILLGRQKKWPPHWYSTLAGFLEPAESVEEAVRREVWEESGVRLGRVVIHSTQPWPYPANLMIGAIGQAIPGEEANINLGNDPELEDAKWCTIEEVREALRVGASGLGEPPAEGYTEGNLRLPPRTAIANQLLAAVVNGFLGAEVKL